jgi:hypothetical protein
MRFKIEPNSIEFEDMKSKLEAKFPEYTFKVRQKNFLVAAKSGTIGTNILLRKNKLIVVGNFPSMGPQLIFVLAILISLLLALIIYLIAFHPKMKKLEKEIGGYLAEEYQLQ